MSGEALTLRVNGYKTLHTEDTWQVNRLENSLLLVVTSNEFANYFEKRGGAVFLRWQPDVYLSLRLGGLYQQDVTMRKDHILHRFILIET